MVKWSHYRPGVTQRVGRGIVLLFHDRGTRSGWVVSSTPRPHFTHGKDPVPNLQEAGWAPGPVWTGGKSRPHWDSIPDLSAHSQSLYRLSYPAHTCKTMVILYKHGVNLCLTGEQWILNYTYRCWKGYWSGFPEWRRGLEREAVCSFCVIAPCSLCHKSEHLLVD